MSDGHAGGAEVQRSRRRRPSVRVGAAAIALVVPVASLLAAAQVRRMRREAREMQELVLDLDLPGVDPGRIVVTLGDSSSAGFRLTDPEQSASRRVARALHLRDGRATRLRSVARNGATTVDVLAEQVESAAGAEVVLIGVGANDAKDRIPIRDVEAALTALLVRVREIATPGARIVLVGCPDLSVAPGLPFLLRVAMRPLSRRVARLQERVTAEHDVELVPLPRARLGAEVFADDGFHPGPLGHERVAARILAAI